MGHSFVSSKNDEFLVRDTTFEYLLELLMERISVSRAQEVSRLGDIIEEWYKEWEEMPPGCKGIEIDQSGLKKEQVPTLIGQIENIKEGIDRAERPETYKACENLIALLDPLK